MGTDTAPAKTKQEPLTQHTLPKMEPMQTSKRKLIPVLSLLFHTQLLRRCCTQLLFTTQTRAQRPEAVISRNTEGEKLNLSSHPDVSGQIVAIASLRLHGNQLLLEGSLCMERVH